MADPADHNNTSSRTNNPAWESRRRSVRRTLEYSNNRDGSGPQDCDKLCTEGDDWNHDALMHCSGVVEMERCVSPVDDVPCIVGALRS